MGQNNYKDDKIDVSEFVWTQWHNYNSVSSSKIRFGAIRPEFWVKV